MILTQIPRDNGQDMLSYTSSSITLNSDSEEYESRECQSHDRQCVRCLLHNLEANDEDTYLGKDRYTRSFSPSDSFEDLFANDGECDEETKVLFCKSLDVTSDEDEDRYGVKRTYEDTRDSKSFETSKKTCKWENYGNPQRLSSHSLRSFPSPLSVRSLRISHRRARIRSTTSASSRSDLSTKSQSDGPGWNKNHQQSTWETDKVRKTKKKQQKEKHSDKKTENLSISEKTVMASSSSCDNSVVKKASGRSKEKNSQPKKHRSHDSPENLQGVNQNASGKSEAKPKKMQMPDLRCIVRDICEKAIPSAPSRMEINKLPAIEEKLESEKQDSQCSRSTESDSVSNKTSSSASSRQDPKSSAVKSIFSDINIKRRTPSPFDKSGRPRPNPSSHSGLQNGPRLAQENKNKNAVDLPVNAASDDKDLIQKKSAKSDKCSSALKTPGLTNKMRPAADYLTAPAVIVSIEESIPTQMHHEKHQKALNQVASGQSVPLGILSELGFLRNFQRGICAVYTPRFPVIHRPPSVRITELKQAPVRITEVKHPVRITELKPESHQSIMGACSLDGKNEQIMHAISDMMMEINQQASECLLGKKAISAGPCSETKQRWRMSQVSLEERRKQIRRKISEKTGWKYRNVEQVDDSNKDEKPMEKSPSVCVPEEKPVLNSRRHPVRLSSRRIGKSSALRKETDCAVMPQKEEISSKQQLTAPKEYSPSFQAAEIRKEDSRTVLRNKARSKAMKNLFPMSNRNEDNEHLQSSGTDSFTESFPTPESEYATLESNSGESYETAGPRSRASLSGRRPPSRRPHLSPSSRQQALGSVPSNSEQIPKLPGQPRTNLTMQMQSKADPGGTPLIREQLGTEIQDIMERLKREDSIPETKTFANGKLGTIAMKKRAGHPLQNKTLLDFIEERKRILSNRQIHDSRFTKRRTVSSSKNSAF